MNQTRAAAAVIQRSWRHLQTKRQICAGLARLSQCSLLKQRVHCAVVEGVLASATDTALLQPGTHFSHEHDAIVDGKGQPINTRAATCANLLCKLIKASSGAVACQAQQDKQREHGLSAPDGGCGAVTSSAAPALADEVSMPYDVLYSTLLMPTAAVRGLMAEKRSTLGDVPQPVLDLLTRKEQQFADQQAHTQAQAQQQAEKQKEPQAQASAPAHKEAQTQTKEADEHLASAAVAAKKRGPAGLCTVSLAELLFAAVPWAGIQLCAAVVACKRAPRPASLTKLSQNSRTHLHSQQLWEQWTVRTLLPWLFETPDPRSTEAEGGGVLPQLMLRALDQLAQQCKDRPRAFRDGLHAAVGTWGALCHCAAVLQRSDLLLAVQRSIRTGNVPDVEGCSMLHAVPLDVAVRLATAPLLECRLDDYGAIPVYLFRTALRVAQQGVLGRLHGESPASDVELARSWVDTWVQTMSKFMNRKGKVAAALGEGIAAVAASSHGRELLSLVSNGIIACVCSLCQRVSG